jgi:cephalosporin hydroxylase
MTLTTDITAIDQTIQQLEREAAQAQTISSVSGSEAAIAQKAIRELTTAKAEILAKERLWDRDAQLQRALADRKAVADRVRLALGARGSL